MPASADEAALATAVFHFERSPPELSELPIAARRALDQAGLRLSLEAWRALPLDERRRIVLAGAADVVDSGTVVVAVRRADPPPQPIERVTDPDPVSPPVGLARALPGLEARTWSRLRALDRCALAHAHRRSIARNDPTILTEAYEELVVRRSPAAASANPPDAPVTPPPEVSSHLTAAGEVRMVDVGPKPVTTRRAVATGHVRMRAETLARLARQDTPKGEVLATARVAGIMAAKRTHELIPLCHPLGLTHVLVQLDLDPAASRVNVTATAEADGKTGVEMEALVAVSVACLTIYDMLKGIDRDMVLSDISLVEKSGGRSGHYRREAHRAPLLGTAPGTRLDRGAELDEPSPGGVSGGRSPPDDEDVP